MKRTTLTEYTPCPWKVGGNPLFIYDDHHSIQRGPIALLSGSDRGYNASGNARRIVLCVNNHDALVDALSELLAYYDVSHKMDGESFGKTLEKCRTVLAKLKE